MSRLLEEALTKRACCALRRLPLVVDHPHVFQDAQVTSSRLACTERSRVLVIIASTIHGSYGKSEFKRVPFLEEKSTALEGA